MDVRFHHASEYRKDQAVPLQFCAAGKHSRDYVYAKVASAIASASVASVQVAFVYYLELARRKGRHQAGTDCLHAAAIRDLG
jgi:hypothetical protein